MSRRLQDPLVRCARVVALLVGVLSAPGSAPRAQDPNVCDQPGEAPDVVVADVNQVARMGTIGDITAYGLGNVHCNIGTCWANWFFGTNQHPVMAQNLFRLKDGRFEHVGQSWVMHAYFALSSSFCSNQCLPTNGSHLGVDCSDVNSASSQAGQARLGPRSEVNAFTGVFPQPFGTEGQLGDTIYKRLQVHAADLEPDLNAGAQYFGEVQLVTADDAASGNGDNNSAYRRVTLTESTPGTYNLVLTGSTETGKPAIEAWRAADPDVVVSKVPVPGDGSFYVGARVTELEPGLWRYEYAVQNVNSHRSASSFRVPLPFGANVSNAGFHDVDYHSGEPFDGTDWAASVGGLAVAWSTEPFDQNPEANALRWGTLYNFRFDADVAPAPGRVTLGLFRPGTPEAVAVTTVAPAVCDGDAVCDPGEDCDNCAVDCAGQGGGDGCCGDGACDPGEGACSCLVDCGPPFAVEPACDDGADDDCDGLADCNDPDCCTDGACDGPDGDADGFEACDCNDADPLVWLTPGETVGLRLARFGTGTVLEWDTPSEAGAVAVSYEVLRSGNSLNFVTSTICMPDAEPTDTTVTDAGEPAPGGVFYYEVRAQNACPNGEGPLGRQSNGSPRAGRSCP